MDIQLVRIVVLVLERLWDESRKKVVLTWQSVLESMDRLWEDRRRCMKH